MKKKKIIYQILSFMFCCMFVLFVGCEPNSGGGGGGSDEDHVAALDATKVLSRPSGYSFADAVGEYSENYYNLYARAILNYLYSVYERNDSNEAKLDAIINPDESNIQNGYIALQGNTFSKTTPNYYLFDSIRYTITKVETTYTDASASTQESQLIYFDLDNSWNWKVKETAKSSTAVPPTDDRLYFEKLAEESVVTNFYDFNINNKNVKYNSSNDWASDANFGNNQTLQKLYPNFKLSYAGDIVTKDSVEVGGIPVDNYAKSPFYEKEVENAQTITAKNYYQDALEYAIYMFVLGYDYNTYDQDGNVVEGTENADDAPYFNFHISYGNDGYVSGITVDGWGNNVPIADALKLAKARYNEIGGYVGVVEKNLNQITNFIVDKVIGENSDDTFTVTQKGFYVVNSQNSETTTQPDDLTFNRNYKAVANNIVRYACEKAPIGYTLAEDGTVQPVSLSNGFSASMITEYKGNYFFGNYDTIVDGVHVNDDTELFKNIEAAEYQSLVVYPGDELKGKSLGDMWLDFEYFENNTPGKTMLDELVVNVGFRYYDHSKNEIVVDKQEQMTIKYGKNGELKDANGEDISDESMFLIGDDDEGPYQVVLEPDSVKFSEFNNEIGNGVLDPFVSGTEIDPSAFKASKYLSGLDNARKYYKLNDSQTAGQYGTLNEQMFAGADGCSFIEIYFDIVKDPTKTGICYDFKVCFRTIAEHEDANSEPDDDDFNEDEDF